MQVIELSADEWKSIVDIHDALGRAPYEYDGRAVANVRNINGLLELFVWDVWKPGNPPYAIRTTEASRLSAELRERLDLIQTLLAED